MNWNHRYIEGPYKRPINKKVRRIFLLTLLLVLVFSIIAILFIQHALSSKDTSVYVVQEGDTLWNICKKIYGEMEDTREMVYLMQKLNGIEDPGQLRPGMKLYLPVVVD